MTLIVMKTLERVYKNYYFIIRGDIIQVDLDNQKITADGKTYAIPAIPENLYHIIMDGGLVKSIMKKVEKGLL